MARWVKGLPSVQGHDLGDLSQPRVPQGSGSLLSEEPLLPLPLALPSIRAFLLSQKIKILKNLKNRYPVEGFLQSQHWIHICSLKGLLSY